MKKSYFAVPLTVALVASTIPAQAATVQLKDIKNHPYEKEIISLVQQGIITGYADSTYRPELALKRSDVVYLLGRYLEKKGYQAPSDYKTNFRFKDLTPKMDNEFLKYAAIVNEAGVFIGANGRLLPNELLSRHHAALILVRTVSKVNGIDYADQVDDVHFMDIKHLPLEDQKVIAVFHQYQLVKENYFNPKEVTTRGDFAHFLYGMHNLTENQLISITKAQVISKNHVQFTFSNGEVHDEILTKSLEYNVPTTITFSKFGQRFSKSVTMTTMEEFGVTSVTNQNASQFTIRFNQPVHLKSVYSAADLNTLFTLTARDYQGTPAFESAKLSEDKMSLTIQTNGYPPLNKRYLLTINEIASTNGDKLVDFSDIYTFVEDKVAPKIASIEQIEKGKVLIRFTEPLRYTPSFTSPVISGNKYVYNYTSEMAEDRTAMVFDLSNARVDNRLLQDNEKVSFEFYSLADYANNTTNNVKTTISKSNVQNTADKPKVISIDQVGARQIEITFNKAMNLSSLYNIRVYMDNKRNYIESIEQSKSNPNHYIITTEDFLRGKGEIQTSGSYYVTDLLDAKLSFTQSITFKQDASKANIISTEVLREDNSEYLYIHFDKNIILRSNAKIVLSGSYVINGQRRQLSTPIQADLFPVEGTKQTAKVLLSELLKGIDRENTSYNTDVTFTGVTNEYGVAITGGASVQFNRSKDYSFNTNQLKVVSVDTSHSNPDIRNSSIVRVNFNHMVNIDSAMKLENYSIPGLMIDKVELNRATQKSVDLYVRPNTIHRLTSYYLSVENIMAQNSLYPMEDFYDEIYLNDNIAPTLSSSHYVDSSTGEIHLYNYGYQPIFTAQNELTLTFSEALGNIPEDLFIVRNASGDVLESVAMIHPVNNNKVIIKLDRNLIYNQKVSIQIRSTRSLTDLNYNEFVRRPMTFTTPYY